VRSGIVLTRKFATVVLNWLENLARAAGGVLDWLENLARAAGGVLDWLENLAGAAGGVWTDSKNWYGLLLVTS
jgi:hypothetical protein